MKHIATRGLGLHVVALLAACWSNPGLAITVNIDQFTVVRNGSILFNDTFDDGAPPPSAPSFVSGAAASYNVFGTIPAGAESAGVLQLDSANGGLSANAIEAPRLIVSALLLTSITGGPSQLGIGNTLELTGTFDLTVPGPEFSVYGIRFTDVTAGVIHQFAQIFVTYNEALAQAFVAYQFQDFDANTTTVLGSTPLAAPAGADEIRFTLSRPSTANNNFFGSFSYLSGGVVVDGEAFNTPSVLFQGEDFVRAQFFTAQAVPVAAIPEPEIVLLMSIGGVFLWVAKRRGRGRVRSVAAG